ncbi:hypothetical protein MUP00_09255 [Candidatus Bathyarchaeota archaeon]|nr:hypothetical protein [Candidatus Bathyarchaeota archaeon]
MSTSADLEIPRIVFAPLVYEMRRDFGDFHTSWRRGWVLSVLDVDGNSRRLRVNWRGYDSILRDASTFQVRIVYSGLLLINAADENRMLKEWTIIEEDEGSMLSTQQFLQQLNDYSRKRDAGSSSSSSSWRP